MAEQQPDAPPPDREQVQALIVAALDASIDRCARCKVCDSQINAVMHAVWPLLEGDRAKLAELEAAHKRDALAVEAHRARADHQQRRAFEAEEELARFAAHVSRYDELAGQAAQGQRDSDVLKEIRRRIPPLERQAGRCRVAEAKLAEVKSLCLGVRASVTHGATPIVAVERILAITGTEEETREH